LDLLFQKQKRKGLLVSGPAAVHFFSQLLAGGSKWRFVQNSSGGREIPTYVRQESGEKGQEQRTADALLGDGRGEIRFLADEGRGN